MKKLILVLLASMLPIAAYAEWVGGVGYYRISDDEGGISVDLSALAVSAGYRFDSEGNFFFMPELRIGTGIGDDTVFGVKVEIESILALSARGQYEFDSGLYLFGFPAYTNLDVKASGFGGSASADDWEFGVGAGIGFNFSENASGELSYETYSGTDVIGGALKIGFK